MLPREGPKPTKKGMCSNIALQLLRGGSRWAEIAAKRLQKCFRPHRRQVLKIISAHPDAARRNSEANSFFVSLRPTLGIYNLVIIQTGLARPGPGPVCCADFRALENLHSAPIPFAPLLSAFSLRRGPPPPAGPFGSSEPQMLAKNWPPPS